eukprot:5826894-Pyramimonas_sp.AAC.1
MSDAAACILWTRKRTLLKLAWQGAATHKFVIVWQDVALLLFSIFSVQFSRIFLWIFLFNYPGISWSSAGRRHNRHNSNISTETVFSDTETIFLDTDTVLLDIRTVLLDIVPALLIIETVVLNIEAVLLHIETVLLVTTTVNTKTVLLAKTGMLLIKT